MAKAVADVNDPDEKQGGFASDDSDITGFSHMHDSGTGGVIFHLATAKFYTDYAFSHLHLAISQSFLRPGALGMTSTTVISPRLTVHLGASMAPSKPSRGISLSA